VPYSRLATPSETIAVLRQHGLYTKKRLGQHFLVDDNVVGRIIALAELRGDEVVVEVGPGIGTLTSALCDRARAVVAIERDAGLLPALAETSGSCEHLAVLHDDAVTADLRRVAQPFGAPVALVANLPYAVAATVVLRFFEELPTVRSATVMVQAEVADRMAALPGTKQYGAYTVKLRLFAEPAGRFQVARTCFLPPPRVDSAVLRLVRSPLSNDASLLQYAADVADAAFAQRRKTVRNSLRATLDAVDAVIDAALGEAQIDGSARAETIEPLRFLALAAALRARESE